MKKSSAPCQESSNFPLEQLVTRISARIVRSSSEELDDVILQSLKEIVTVCNVDRCGLLSVKGNTLIVTHGWQHADVPQLPEGQNLADLYPWSWRRLFFDREVVAIDRIDDLPPEAHVDQQSHRQRGTRSSLTIPLFLGYKALHIFGVGCVKQQRNWDPELIRRLRLLGEVFVSALERREVLEALQHASECLDLAADSAEVVFWELDLETGGLWATEKAFELFGSDLKTEMTLTKFLTKIHNDDHALIHEAVGQVRDKGAELLVEYRAPDKNGQERWMLSRGRLIRMKSASTPPRLMGVTIDITQQKSMEQQLQGQLEEIRQLRRQLELENSYLRNEVAGGGKTKDLIGFDSMQRLRMQIEQVARTDSTVLIQGETGTGKELVAETVHRQSERSQRILVKVNCAALPAALVESELFGREKGAFTGALSRQIGRFELADGATLFLDEIGEMPIETQSKLLRVLQAGEFERLGSPRTIKVDVRVIVATNRDLLAEVEQGRFRRDLYYRLNVFPLTVPPLRERIDDIPQLVWEFVNEFGEKMGKKIRRIANDDMCALMAYAWPGNVRELRNIIEHAMIVSRGDRLEIDCPRAVKSSVVPGGTLEEVERRHIEATLIATGGRIKGPGAAAQRLGLNPSTLYSRMRKLGIRQHSS